MGYIHTRNQGRKTVRKMCFILTSIETRIRRNMSVFMQCEVQISTIIENQEKCVGEVLAWFYYFNNLQNVLPEIKVKLQASEWSDRPIYCKLFILIPYHCDTGTKIEDLDHRFHKEGVIICNKSYSVGVYRVQVAENQSKYFAMEYASPSEILKGMSISATVKSVPNDKRNEEIRIFYRTLKDILKEPILPNSQCRDTYELITFDPTQSSTENGSTNQEDLFLKLKSKQVEATTSESPQYGHAVPSESSSTQQSIVVQIGDSSDKLETILSGSRVTQQN